MNLEDVDYNRYLHKFDSLNSEPDFKAIFQKEGSVLNNN